MYKRQRNQRLNCQHPLDHRKSKRIPEKHLLLLYWLGYSFWLVDHNKMENSSRDGNTRPPYLPPEKPVCRSTRNTTGRGTMEWFWNGKGVCQGCILSPAYLTSMQSTSCKMLGWMKQGLESRLPGEISITSDMQMTPSLWQKAKKN